MGKASSKLVTALLSIALAVGLALLLYPSVSDWWNSSRQTHAVASYGSLVDEADNARVRAIWQDALEYNEQLAKKGTNWTLTEAELAEYESQLSMDASGIMGYINIPKIRCTLPLYHGTSDEVLQVAVGHIEGSSLPVGGESSHCVVSGHRGLPSARLFTDLDQLEVGDTFTLRVLDQVLTYEVDKISIVFPHEMDLLTISEGEDLCTLVTCTPYGVNSHRLLVRGHRVDKGDDVTSQIVADALVVDKSIVALCLGVPIILLMFALVMVRGGKRKA